MPIATYKQNQYTDKPDYDTLYKSLDFIQNSIREFYPARELSIIQTKLDEARLWLDEYRRNNE